MARKNLGQENRHIKVLIGRKSCSGKCMLELGKVLEFTLIVWAHESTQKCVRQLAITWRTKHLRKTVLRFVEGLLGPTGQTKRLYQVHKTVVKSKRSRGNTLNVYRTLEKITSLVHACQSLLPSSRWA